MSVRNLAFVCILSATCLVACDESSKVTPSTVQAPPTSADKPSQISYGTSMNFSAEGMLRAILHAGRVQTFDQRRYTWLDSGVKVDFFNRDGKHSSTLTSKTAKVIQTSNDMSAYGNVHIVSDSGTIVDTDSMLWNNRDQMLRSDAPVKIVEKNGRTTNGVGFESDQSLEHYRILHPTIVAPAGSLETKGGNSNNDLKPQAPVVPGSGALGGLKLTPLDTSSKK
jgi:LPS export ABC transporter protein LptC